MNYSLKAFGLNIQSEFPFRGVEPNEKGFFDVTVEKAFVPEVLKNSTFKGVSMESNAKEFLLRVPNVGNFLMAEGKSIKIQPSPKAEMRELELFFYGSALSVILMQRGIVPLHGSAFKKNEKAVIISGISGAGKSSLLRHFINQGYKALTDDVCALSIQNKNVILSPSYPFSKIWADIMDKFKLSKESEKQVRPNIEKYSQPFIDEFYDQAIEVEAIYILRSKNVKTFEIEEIKGFEKFKELKSNLYRPKFPEATGKTKETFIILNQLAQQAKLFNLTRSTSIDLLEPFNEFANKAILK